MTLEKTENQGKGQEQRPIMEERREIDSRDNEWGKRAKNVALKSGQPFINPPPPRVSLSLALCLSLSLCVCVCVRVSNEQFKQPKR